MNHSCHEDHYFDGVHIPAGIEVIILTYAIHRESYAWPNPEKFDPERFRGFKRWGRRRYRASFVPVFAIWSWPSKLHRDEVRLDGDQDRSGENLDEVQVCTAESAVTQVPLALQTGVVLSPNNGVFLRVETVLDIFEWQRNFCSH